VSASTVLSWTSSRPAAAPHPLTAADPQLADKFDVFRDKRRRPGSYRPATLSNTTKMVEIAASTVAVVQGTMPGARRRGRPRTAWMNNIKTWTGLSAEESVRMTEDRDKWRKYVRGVANRRIEDG